MLIKRCANEHIPGARRSCASDTACGLLWAIPAGGQMQNGEIVGLVTDVSGAVISNATVKITWLDPGSGFRPEVPRRQNGG